ncbi:hypothetical protein [Desulfolithobacter sp.]
MLVSRELKKLEEELPGLTINRVDIVTHPGRAWKEGIRMIPTLRAGKQTLSGLFLSPGQIRSFVAKASKKEFR